jgi:hypothetical protein
MELAKPIIERTLPIRRVGDRRSYTPSKARKVANLNSFRFDKESRKIILQKTKKLLVVGVALLSVMIEEEVIENIRDDPLSISSVTFPSCKHQRKT